MTARGSRVSTWLTLTVLVVQAIVTFGWRTVTPEPALPGRWAALVPVAFPTLLTPGLNLYLGGRNRLMVNYDFAVLDGLDGLGRSRRRGHPCRGATP